MFSIFTTFSLAICLFLFFIVFIRSRSDIRWKGYKNTASNQTKTNIKIYENIMLSVIKVSIELTTNGKKVRIKVQIENDEQ